MKEGTPGKYSLTATHPDGRAPILEGYPTIVEAEARAAELKQDGFDVKIELSWPPEAR